MTRFGGFWILVLAMHATLAMAMDLELRNPAIDALKARVATRAASIQKWKDAGAIGEETKGTLAVLPQAKLSLGERKEVRDLVLSENEDRAAMFREWIFANTLSEAELPKIGSAFGKKQYAAAAPAHFIQNPSTHEWVQKKDLR